MNPRQLMFYFLPLILTPVSGCGFLDPATEEELAAPAVIVQPATVVPPTATAPATVTQPILPPGIGGGGDGSGGGGGGGGGWS